MPRAVVCCLQCGTPGVVIFSEKGIIEKAFFVCKCPRPTVAEANAKIDEASLRPRE